VTDKLPPTVLDATFIAEARGVGQLPTVGPPEIAIAGRSNVGKSTLLNRLAGRKSLARTSKTPGRTRGIIFYDLIVRLPPEQDDRTAMRLVDLPGYGYAQVSQAERKSWQALIEGYVEKRETLALFLVLVDARRGLQDEEAQLLEWLETLGTPRQLVFTKIDKLSASERGALKGIVRGRLGALPVTLVSGETGEGVDRLWAAIEHAVRSQNQAEAPADGQ
jgi:GTP-binding protein